MKKLGLLLTVLAVSACVRAGDHGYLSVRNALVERFNGYNVSFYHDDGPKLVKSEYIEEKNYRPDEKMVAYRGYSVLNNKIYRKDYYSQHYFKADKNAMMDTSSLPHKIKAGEVFKLIGYATIDGKRYRLFPGDLNDFVIFVDENGRIWNKMGQIRNDSYVVLLNTEFFVKPENVRIVEVSSAKTEQTKPIKGFDVKYEGVRLDRIWFTFFDYSDSQNSGKFEEISFPNKPGLIEINGVGFRVLHADNDKVEYMVIKEDK